MVIDPKGKMFEERRKKEKKKEKRTVLSLQAPSLKYLLQYYYSSLRSHSKSSTKSV